MDKKNIKIISWIGGGCAALVLVAVCCVAAFFIYRSYNQHGNQAGISQTFPGLVPFASLASQPSSPIDIPVDGSSSITQLGDGVSLQVPAGAFATPTTITVVQVDVAFDQVDADVIGTRFYWIATPIEVGALDSPVILEVPKVSSTLSVVKWDGTAWQPVQVTPGLTTRVEIAHFSGSAFGFLEWWSSRSEALGDVIDTDVLDGNAAARVNLENEGNEETRAFYGVGDQAVSTHEEMCMDLIDVVGQYNSTENRKFPSDVNLHMDDLYTYLGEGDYPSAKPGYFWNLTKDSMDEINNRVLSANSPLSPAQVLKIAIDANNGNVPLGILAANNYLKDKTYRGRYDWDTQKLITPENGAPVSHLQSWRTDTNIAPAGYYDKMGPLYHIFSAMVAETWFPTRAAGDAAITAEAFLRSLRIGQDRPDPQKGQADQCGVDVGHWLRDHSPTTQSQPVNPSGSGGIGTGTGAGNWHGAACQEAEGTFAYRWSLDLILNPESGGVKGTLKFHDCPGGGRVLYTVEGELPKDSIYTLNGERREGGGDLFNSSPENLVFTFDSFNVTIDPDLGP